MARGLIALFTVGVMIYALVDCARSLPSQVQRLSRAGWVVVIVFVPLLGAILYLVFGRTPDVAPGSGPARSRVVAPDDDPEFLRSLDLQRRRQAAEERRRREAEDKRRKAEQRDQAKADEAKAKAEAKAERAAEKAEAKAERAAEKKGEGKGDRAEPRGGDKAEPRTGEPKDDAPDAVDLRAEEPDAEERG